MKPFLRLRFRIKRLIVIQYFTALTTFVRNSNLFILSKLIIIIIEYDEEGRKNNYEV